VEKKGEGKKRGGKGFSSSSSREVPSLIRDRKRVKIAHYWGKEGGHYLLQYGKGKIENRVQGGGKGGRIYREEKETSPFWCGRRPGKAFRSPRKRKGGGGKKRSVPCVGRGGKCQGRSLRQEEEGGGNRKFCPPLREKGKKRRQPIRPVVNWKKGKKTKSRRGEVESGCRPKKEGEKRRGGGEFLLYIKRGRLRQ